MSENSILLLNKYLPFIFFEAKFFMVSGAERI